MSFEVREIDNGQGFVMRRGEMHRRRNAHLSSFFPARRTKTPLITWFEPWKTEFRARRDEVIAAVKTVIQKLGGDAHADSVHALIHGASIATAIAEKSGQRVRAARRQVIAKHVAGSGLCLTHAGTSVSGLLAAAFKTPQ